MKFDFAIGNPPYQEESVNKSTTNGQAPQTNIFHYFQMQADEITNEGSVMIYPGGRWIHQSGKGLKTFGFNQINDKRLSVVEFFPDASDVFGQAASLSDGISIVIKNQKKTTAGFEYRYNSNGTTTKVFSNNPGDEIIPLDPKDLGIQEKIKEFVSCYKLDYLHDTILPRSLFGIESDFVSKNPTSVKPYTDTYSLKNNEIKLLANDKAGKAGRSCWYVVDRNIIPQGKSYIDEWQVIVSSANAGGQKRDNQIEIADNVTAFGRSRLALRSFTNREEAYNFYNYCCSYFIKYCFLLTDEALTTLGKLVPDIKNYKSNNSLIDFNKKIDDQLFKLAKLNDEEIQYISHKVTGIRKGSE